MSNEPPCHHMRGLQSIGASKGLQPIFLIYKPVLAPPVTLVARELPMKTKIPEELPKRTCVDRFLDWVPFNKTTQGRLNK